VVNHGIQPEHAARRCLRSNLPRWSWPTALVRRTRLPEDIRTTAAHSATKPPRKMMDILIQWTQVTVGVGFAFHTESWRSLHSVGQWLPSLCEFLADSDDIANTYTVRIRRVYHRILMEDALTGNFTDSEMRNINRCRVVLQIECLSDVCTADGLTTDPGLQAQPPTVASQSTIKWPLQAIPGSRSWATWRRFLKPYTRDSTNNRLR
jgi:hypothetical protein